MNSGVTKGAGNGAQVLSCRVDFGIVDRMKRSVGLLSMTLLMVWAAVARAQTPAAPAPPPVIRNSTAVPPAPVTADGDKGVSGELPLNTAGDQTGMDAAPASSPVAAGAHAGYFVPGTMLQIRLDHAIDSGHQRNGDTVRGVLLGQVRAANGRVMAAGTKVSATVISSARAGTMASYGVLSLQVYKVGGIGVFTNVLDFDGQEGRKDLADSAPEKGTEAAVKQGTTLQFKVLGAGDNADLTERTKRPGTAQPGGPK